MTPRFRDWIGVFGSRNGTFDPDFCDYGRRCLSSLYAGQTVSPTFYFVHCLIVTY